MEAVVEERRDLGHLPGCNSQFAGLGYADGDAAGARAGHAGTTTGGAGLASDLIDLLSVAQGLERSGDWLPEAHLDPQMAEGRLSWQHRTGKLCTRAHYEAIFDGGWLPDSWELVCCKHRKRELAHAYLEPPSRNQ